MPPGIKIPKRVGPPLSKESRRDRYDYEAAIAAGLEPDAGGHWPSRVPDGPNKGLILKLPGHPTLEKTLKIEKDLGFKTLKSGDRLFSFVQKK